jgi:hypothetical protein
MLRRPKPSVRVDKSALNNAQGPSDSIILGLNEGHNKLPRYRLFPFPQYLCIFSHDKN